MTPNMQSEWQPDPKRTYTTERILITVKAYPNPSKKYIETVCVAGITDTGQWRRLFPVPFRQLEDEQKFSKYRWISVKVRRSNDPRPESYHIDANSIVLQEHLDGKDKWTQRDAIIRPLVQPSIEVLRERQARDGTSLGIIRPKTWKKLHIIEVKERDWNPHELAKLQQLSFSDMADASYHMLQILEKIPYRFQYEFFCDDARCTGHKLTINSWEVLETYRKWQLKYGTEWQSKFLEMYAQKLWDEKHELHLCLGTVRAHPQEWTIVDIYYPPPPPPHLQPSLF